MKTYTKSKLKTSEKNSNTNEDFTQASKKWFESIPIMPSFPEECTNVIGSQVSELKEEAKKCNETETAEYYNKNQKSNSTFHWMKTIMTKGTSADKIASYTVVIQNSPVHNLDTLKNFISLVKIEKHQESNGLIDTLTQLFIEDLLIPDRKLQSFEQKNLSSLSQLSCGNAITRRKILSLWYFEDQLKQVYSSFIDALNSAAHNSITATKEKAIAAMSNLLSSNPEQEKKLLSFIVNKLGDPLQKVASKAIYCLEQLLRTHSNMQSVVLNEVEKLIFRQNISTKAQYYGLCFLSQFYLNHEESEIANRLIEIYFGFFKACVKQGEVDSRMMSALLMGVNRAYPYANLKEDKISEHLDTIYRVVHIANFNVSLQALTLLYHVSGYENNATDRFYCALYKKLLDPQLFNTTHQAMLLSLVYKALIKDDQVTRIKAVVKRLFQLCLFLTPSFTCGILYLISQLIGKHKKFNSGILKQICPDDLNVKKEIKEKGKKAEDTRKNNSANAESNYILNTNNSLSNETLPNDSCELINSEEIPDNNPVLMDVKPSDYTLRNLISKYDPFNRNPLYAHSEQTMCSELHYLRQHFHPTISLYASNILNGELIKYQGDPLKDFTLIRFLDRFVFKNPKKENEIKQGPHPTFGRRKLYRPLGAKSMAVNSFNYMKSKEENIPVDEQFLHMYLNKKYSNKSLENVEEDSDADSVGSDEFEEMLENLGGTSKDLDENLDFMNDVENSIKTTKKSSAQDDHFDNAEESDTDLEDDDVDEDLMETGDEDLVDNLGDDDDEDLSFDDGEESLFDDDDGDDDVSNKSKNSKKNKKGLESIFASADEFASLLDEEGISKKRSGGANTLSNLDQAATKQINWEEDRHRWLSGYKRALGKKGGQSLKRSRKHNPDSGNKKKRFKK